MTQYVIANNVNTQLASAASSSATTLTLASSTNLPTLSAGQVMPLTLNDAATGQNYEIVYVTAITGVTLTVIRAQEGTGALTWSVGDYAFCAPTAGTVATSLGNPSNTFQVAPATQSAQSLQLQQNTGVVGSSRNLKASVTTAGTSITFTADEIAIKGAFAGQSQIAANFNQSVSTSNTNAIGGVVGTALAASGFCGIYAAYNPSTGAYGLYGKNGNSLLSNVDTSLTGWIGTLISVWPLNASTQFVPGEWFDRSLRMSAAIVLNTTAAQSLTALSIAAAVPLNANLYAGYCSLLSTSTVFMTLNLWTSGAAGGVLTHPMGMYCLANAASTMVFSNAVVKSQNIGYSTTSGGGAVTFNIFVTGYTI